MTWGSSGHTTTDTTGLRLWDSTLRSASATFNHNRGYGDDHLSVTAVTRPCNDVAARTGL